MIGAQSINSIKKVLTNRPFDALNVVSNGLQYPKALGLIIEAHKPIEDYISRLPNAALSYDSRTPNRLALFHYTIICGIIYRMEKEVLGKMSLGNSALQLSFKRISEKLDFLSRLVDPAYIKTANVTDNIESWDTTLDSELEEVAKDRQAFNNILHLFVSCLAERDKVKYSNEMLEGYRTELYVQLLALTKMSAILGTTQADKPSFTKEKMQMGSRERLMCRLLWGYSQLTGWQKPRKGMQAYYLQYLSKTLTLFSECAPYQTPEPKKGYLQNYVTHALNNYHKVPQWESRQSNIGYLDHRTISRIAKNPYSPFSLFIREEGDEAWDYLAYVKESREGMGF